MLCSGASTACQCAGKPGRDSVFVGPVSQGGTPGTAIATAGAPVAAARPKDAPVCTGFVSSMAPSFPQVQNGLLCWAASMQVITATLCGGVGVEQCQSASDRYDALQANAGVCCREDHGGKICNYTAFPQFAHHGFSVTTLKAAWPDWPTLAGEIDAHRPFAIASIDGECDSDQDGANCGSHMTVVRGFGKFDGERLVQVYDPAIFGSYVWSPDDFFRAPDDQRMGRTFYKIKPAVNATCTEEDNSGGCDQDTRTGPSVAPCAAASASAPSPVSGSVCQPGPENLSQQQAIDRSVAVVKAIALVDPLSVGFPKGHEHGNVELLDAVQATTLALNDILTETLPAPPEPPVLDDGQKDVTYTVDGQDGGTITIAPKGSGWRAIRYNTQLTAAAIRSALTAANVPRDAQKSYTVLFVPTLRSYFLRIPGDKLVSVGNGSDDFGETPLAWGELQKRLRTAAQKTLGVPLTKKQQQKKK